jgi:hypothetical protein
MQKVPMADARDVVYGVGAAAGAPLGYTAATLGASLGPCSPAGSPLKRARNQDENGLASPNSFGLSTGMSPTATQTVTQLTREFGRRNIVKRDLLASVASQPAGSCPQEPIVLE